MFLIPYYRVSVILQVMTKDSSLYDHTYVILMTKHYLAETNLAKICRYMFNLVLWFKICYFEVVLRDVALFRSLVSSGNSGLEANERWL